MKASIKFREEQRPLVRAKIPISILGHPFLSGVSAGDARELRLDLVTAFDAGPSLRLSYRPNDPSNPFSLVLKTGIGNLGSPTAAPMSMSAEFTLPGRPGAACGPSFSILFKPRLGDFSLRKTTRSPIAAPLAAKKIDIDAAVDAAEAPILGFRSVNSLDSPAGGIHGLLSGIEIAARSVLPLPSRAAVGFRWGVRVPPEFRNAIQNDGGGISINKLPLLVMSKISIESVPKERKAKKDIAGSAAAWEMSNVCKSVSRQLEALQAENGLLRKAVEELRVEVGGSWKATPVATKQLPGGAKPVAAGKSDRRNGVKLPEFAGKSTSEDVSEELKKALMGATGAAGI